MYIQVAQGSLELGWCTCAQHQLRWKGRYLNAIELMADDILNNLRIYSEMMDYNLVFNTFVNEHTSLYHVVPPE